MQNSTCIVHKFTMKGPMKTSSWRKGVNRSGIGLRDVKHEIGQYLVFINLLLLLTIEDI